MTHYKLIDCRLTADFIQDKEARSLAFFAASHPAKLDSELIQDLVRLSRLNDNCNARICLHESPSSNFHEMVILEHRGHYCRPHKHLVKGESCHIIEGKLGIFLFNDEGEIVYTDLLGEDGHLISRLGAAQWHSVVAVSDYAIYHEAKPGPFSQQDDSIFAPWSPNPADGQAVAKYQEKLVQSLS